MKRFGMRKLLAAMLAVALLWVFAAPVLAAGLTVTFTSDSRAEVGGRLIVDDGAMLDSPYISSEAYNALLEHNVIYSWYKNDMLVMEGTYSADSHIYELTVSDQGCSLYVKVTFFADDSFQESKKCGEAYSNRITIEASAPKIHTVSLPEATEGKSYYVKLQCSDPDAVFSEFMGSQLSEFGLYLTQHGEIEGVPTKSGNCHVNVVATSYGGGEDSTSYDITIQAAYIVEVEITTQSLPNAVAGEYYSTKLGCTDGDADFSISYNPGGKNDFDKTGLTLSYNGTLEGKPAAAGQYTFTVCASGATGEDYRVYTLTVAAPAETAPTPSETAPVDTTPVDTTPVDTDPIVPTDTTPAAPGDTEPPLLISPRPQPQNQGNSMGLPWWSLLLILAAGIGLGLSVAAIIMKKKQKS